MIVFALMSNGQIPIRILVVDDDALSREVLVLLLENDGYTVDTADSGDAALLHLQSATVSQPQAILADMQMPGTSGAELARQLRKLTEAGTMLVAMSGSEPGETARREFDGFLLKPFTVKSLAEAIAGGSTAAPAEAVRPDALILNETTYRKLAESMRSSQLEQLYAMCLRDVEKRVVEMRRAKSNGDDAAYKREAHAIKGGCGMVGAVELQTLATSMEERGLGDTNHVASLDEFMVACERLRRILVAHEGLDRTTGLPGEDTQ